MKGKIIILLVIISLVAVGVVAYISIQVKNSQTERGSSTNNPENLASTGGTYNLDLSITLPKTDYGINEKVSYEGMRPEFIVKNLGKSFDSYSIYNCKREGYVLDCAGGGTGTGLKSPNIDFSYAAMACRINNQNSLCLMDSYDEAGTYTYELSVYDCKDIKEALGVTSCLNIKAEDVLNANVIPIDSTTKTIIVS